MPRNQSPCIINVDDFESAGNHCVCCAPSNNAEETLWYFDSFGMHYPRIYEERAKKDGMKVIYNTAPYQNIFNVLCGYYWICFLHRWSLGDNYVILKPFSLTETLHNEEYIKKFFCKSLKGRGRIVQNRESRLSVLSHQDTKSRRKFARTTPLVTVSGADIRRVASYTHIRTCVLEVTRKF